MSPNLQVEGTTLENSRVLPSTKVSQNDNTWFRTSTLLCQFAPQFLCMATQPLVLDPFNCTAFTSPLPPTLDIITKLKFDWPFKVNRTPPALLHGTLQRKRDKEEKEEYETKIVMENDMMHVSSCLHCLMTEYKIPLPSYYCKNSFKMHANKILEPL